MDVEQQDCYMWTESRAMWILTTATSSPYVWKCWKMKSGQEIFSGTLTSGYLLRIRDILLRCGRASRLIVRFGGLLFYGSGNGVWILMVPSGTERPAWHQLRAEPVRRGRPAECAKNPQRWMLPHCRSVLSVARISSKLRGFHGFASAGRQVNHAVAVDLAFVIGRWRVRERPLNFERVENSALGSISLQTGTSFRPKSKTCTN